jgi:tRNA-2-methylthio-N6-dimethylallyladenosine synthase
MNKYDSEFISAVFLKNGYVETDEVSDAEFIILNTCSVRERAKAKVYSEIARLNKLIAGKKVKIGICGCVAQHAGEELIDRYDNLSFVVGTEGLHRLPEVLNRAENGEKVIDVEFTENHFETSIFKRKPGISAFVSIMKGCDNYCSYCIVPFVRGKEISRKPSEIIDEIKYLRDLGYKEITLLGQNVNSYGKNLDESINFPKFLNMVNNIDGIERVRFITSHPKDFNEELINVMKDCEKVCEHVHLPLQSGSDKILKMMNRKYTYKDYMEKIDKLKKSIKNIAITSDFIVGFPGESFDDFNNTVNAAKNIEYHTIFAFMYSPRPGTKAALINDNVDINEKKRRLNELIELQSHITYNINKSYEGKTTDVLIEGHSKKNIKVYMGRNRQNQIVNFVSDSLLEPGKIVNVKITEGKKNTLFGKFFN